jgi:hypothetical protein
MNKCLPDSDINISTAIKYTCKEGEILITDYNSRDCSKGSWYNIKKVPANVCTQFGEGLYMDTGGHCSRPSNLPSLAPKVPGQKEKPKPSSPKGAVATNATNSSGPIGNELITVEFIDDLKGDNDAYLGDNCGKYI